MEITKIYKIPITQRSFCTSKILVLINKNMSIWIMWVGNFGNNAVLMKPRSNTYTLETWAWNKGVLNMDNIQVTPLQNYLFSMNV